MARESSRTCTRCRRPSRAARVPCARSTPTPTGARPRPCSSARRGACRSGSPRSARRSSSGIAPGGRSRRSCRGRTHAPSPGAGARRRARAPRSARRAWCSRRTTPGPSWRRSSRSAPSSARALRPASCSSARSRPTSSGTGAAARPTRPICRWPRARCSSTSPAEPGARRCARSSACRRASWARSRRRTGARRRSRAPAGSCWRPRSPTRRPGWSRASAPERAARWSTWARASSASPPPARGSSAATATSRARCSAGRPFPSGDGGRARFALEATINGGGATADRCAPGPTELPARDPAPRAFCLPDENGVGAPFWLARQGFALAGAEQLAPADRRRVVLEGLVFRVHAALEDLDAAAGRVLVSGGLASEPFVPAALATVLGRPVEVLEEGETTLLGAARLASGASPDAAPALATRERRAGRARDLAREEVARLARVGRGAARQARGQPR